MNNFFNVLIAGLLSGSVVSGIVALIFNRRTSRIKEELRVEFERELQVFRSHREWKEQSISQLLGPVYMQLDRTKRAFDRWKDQNLYLEGEIIRKGNTEIRDLLLQYAYLIPPELLNDAGALVAHYDLWLEEFNRQRIEAKGDSRASFVYVYNFPKDSAKAFGKKFLEYWDDLYARP